MRVCHSTTDGFSYTCPSSYTAGMDCCQHCLGLLHSHPTSVATHAVEQKTHAIKAVTCHK